MPATETDRLTGLTTSVAVKAPVRATTTANITLSGLQGVDGVTLAEGDRVLVKNQSNTPDNGIYLASTSAWQRTADFDGARDIVKGTTVQVIEGSANHNQWFNVTSANPVNIGTDSITWGQTYVSLTAVSSATETAAGIAEIATQTETNTGTDDVRFVTPLKLVTYATAAISSAITSAIAALLAATKTVSGLWTFTNTNSTVQTLVDGATIAWDVSAGNTAKITLTASGHTLGAPTNIQTGGFYFLSVIQDATGSRTVNWNAAFKFGTASTPTLTTTASKVDTFTFYSPDGAILYCVGKAQGF